MVDTNILISALLAPTSLRARLLVLWRQNRFALLTAAEQLKAQRRVTRYRKTREQLMPASADLVNELRGLGRCTLDRAFGSDR